MERHEDFDGSLNGKEKSDRSFISSTVNLGLDFCERSSVCALPRPATLETVAFDSAPTCGISYDDLLEHFDELCDTATNLSSPSFLRFPDSANSKAAIGAALLVPLLNQNLANQNLLSPKATFTEMETIHWLRQLLGHPVPSEYRSSKEIGGIFTYGGCLSNTAALLAAREHLFPGMKNSGLPVHGSRIRVLVPEITEHYSVRACMSWLGLGQSNILRILIDADLRIKLEDLRRAIEYERSMGNIILACVAYAGDSRGMTVDNVKDLALLLRKQRVWFHVDACHGFQLIFSRKHRHMVQGLELADSVTVYPHKVLWTPHPCSVVLFKNPKSLSDLSTDSDLILNTKWSLGQISPFIGSKPFDCLKLWAVIKRHGVSGIEELVDARVDFAQSIRKEIESYPDLIVLNKTVINSNIFLFAPAKSQSSRFTDCDIEKLNACSKYISTKLVESGNFILHCFPVKSVRHVCFPEMCSVSVLRLLNGNPLTTLDHIRALFARVAALGHAFMEKNTYAIVAAPAQKPHPIYDILRARLSAFFDGIPHASVAYGSNSASNNTIFSDIYYMVFVPDKFCRTSAKGFLELFKTTLSDWGISRDDEVPLNRKLLVPMSFAVGAAEKIFEGLGLDEVPSIRKNSQFLSSDVMISRLVFNVLTTPTMLLSGSPEILKDLQLRAEKRLVMLCKRSIRGGPWMSAEKFPKEAIGCGDRYGENFLGYKNRSPVVKNLMRIWQENYTVVQPRLIAYSDARLGSPSSGFILALNGFPGVGKLTIAKEVAKLLPSARLVDNHLLIDLAESIEHRRTDTHYFEIRRLIRQAAIEGMARVSEADASFILTTCLSDSKSDVKVLVEFSEVARRRQIAFILVNLICESSVNVARAQSLERLHGSKQKLTDPKVLTTMISNNILLEPDIMLREFEGVSLLYGQLDVTEMKAGDSAAWIASAVTSPVEPKNANESSEQQKV